ncbi:MAG TPA: hypothetical protein V6C58_04635 [Allocoleopsis sp.]
MTYPDIKIERDAKKCPQCLHILEWTSGKTDNSKQEYICRRCRIYIELIGMTTEDQEIIAGEAFL